MDFSADLAWLLGSMAGKTVDPIFWPFAVSVLLCGYFRRIAFATGAVIGFSMFNVIANWRFWQAVDLPIGSAIGNIVVVFAAWALVLWGLVWLFGRLRISAASWP